MKRPDTYAKLQELPINAITPEGWLRSYLETQRDGLTGHLEVAGFPFNTSGWAAPVVKHKSGTGWWPYEQTGYWFDGMIRCGYLINDDGLIQRAKTQIDYVLDHADNDGYLGPSFMKNPDGNNRWPHTIFFRACMAHYSATGERAIVSALRKHYLASTAADHADHRNVTNVETILWTYGRTGDLALLDQAVAAYETYNARTPKADTSSVSLLSNRRATEHGVTFNEIGKLGAILYIYTGEQHFLDAAINGYAKIDRDHMLVDGVCSSTERLRGKDPLDSHETCDIADYTWSCGYLLMATGDARYADKIERACFNAAPGAVRSDFKGLQYFSCPNQVIATATSNHNLYSRGHSWMSYRPNPGTECCPGEVNRIMPNYAARMWMTDGEGNLTAALYGPSRITVPVGSKRKQVTVTEETTYPFSERINLQIHTETPVNFTLTLRIPAWCTSAELTVNDKPAGIPMQPGTFVPLSRTFSDGDRITLVLPMTLALQRWPHHGVSIERGPLVYALRIEENWQIDANDPRSTAEFPAWNLTPASAWNVALAVDEQTLDAVEIVENGAISEPWSIDTAPIELRVPARRVRGWKLDHRDSIFQEGWGPDGLKTRRIDGDFTFTPQLPTPAFLAENLNDAIETVTLVPYGCTKLRLTIFPDAVRGPHVN